MPLTTLAAGTARRSEVNANFALCVLTDTAKTITVTHTWSARQDFGGGFKITGAVSFDAGTFDKDATDGLRISTIAGSANDFALYRPATATKIASVPTGTVNVLFGGSVAVSAAATTQAAGVLSVGNTTQSTVGAAGGASALPATPTGYIKTFIGSTQFVIPYYAQA
jgi:hypothetical protein